MTRKTEANESTADGKRGELAKAIAVWRASKAAAAEAAAQRSATEAALNKERSTDGRLSDAKRVPLICAEITALEAVHVQKVAHADAGILQDQVEVLAGDELACKCDPRHFHDELVDLVEVAEGKRREADEADARVRARIDVAIQASAALAARRQAADLPLPAKLPRPAFSTAVPASPRAWLAALANGVVPAPVEPPTRLAELRREEIDLRSGIEMAERKRGEAAAEAARQRQAEQSSVAQAERARRKERDAELAELQAERERMTALADAHRRREIAAASALSFRTKA